MTALVVLTGAACGDSSGPPIALRIGPNGGTFNSGIVTIVVPPGALAAETTFTVQATSNVPNGLLVQGTAYEVGPSGITFAVACTLRVNYASLAMPAGGVLESELGVYKGANLNSSWALQPTVIDTAANLITGVITSLSTFGVVGKPAGSVAILPATPALSAGDSTVLTATVRDSNNAVLPARTVTWSTSAASIATATSTGANTARLRALAAGNAIITATTQDGIASTAAAAVAPPGGAQPFLVEDFSTYTSTVNLLANPRVIYAPSEDISVGGGNVILDLTTGFGSSNRSMKYVFLDRTLDLVNRCQDFTISRAINTQNKTHLWIEVYVMFSASWRVSAPGAWGCTSNPDYKLFIIPVNGGSSRYNLLTQNPHFVWGYPGVEDASVINNPTPSAVWDGQWHRYRMEISVSSSNNAADAVARFWLDNTRLANLTNLVINRINIPFIALGRNLNQGPGQTQSVNIGLVRLFDVNPGW